jgi:ABC-type nitrate/sulfonate/bicarbonate transport system permease component
MRALEASRWQTILMLEIPAALPILLGGLKVGATLSVIGAVVGEFVASDRGLGYLLKQGQQLYDTPLVFVGIATLVLLAQLLYRSVVLADRVLVLGPRPTTLVEEIPVALERPRASASLETTTCNLLVQRVRAALD